jgi:hypothetical protein
VVNPDRSVSSVWVTQIAGEMTRPIRPYSEVTRLTVPWRKEHGVATDLRIQTYVEGMRFAAFGRRPLDSSMTEHPDSPALPSTLVISCANLRTRRAQASWSSACRPDMCRETVRS